MYVATRGTSEEDVGPIGLKVHDAGKTTLTPDDVVYYRVILLDSNMAG